MGTVAVLVGDGGGQGHQVIRGQTRRIIRIGRVGMHHGPQLVEGDVTVGGDADREHQQVGGGRAAFHDGAVERQVDGLTGGGIGQPGAARDHAQRIGQRTRTIGAKRRAEVGGKVLGGVGGQHRFVDCQRWLRAGRTDARPVVFEDHLGADFGGRGGGLAQREAADIKIGVVIAPGV